MLQFVNRSWKKILQENINWQWVDVPLVEEKLELEEQNFRVDSTGWAKKTIDWVDFLVSPCGGIKEYLYSKDFPELTGEQLFNWEAAIRETKKAGKRMPTDEEFTLLLNNKSDMKNVIYAGVCSSGGGSCVIRGDNAYYWSSTVYAPSPTNSWYRYLNYSGASVNRYNAAQTYDFSVRCLKN